MTEDADQVHGNVAMQKYPLVFVKANLTVTFLMQAVKDGEINLLELEDNIVAMEAQWMLSPWEGLKSQRSLGSGSSPKGSFDGDALPHGMACSAVRCTECGNGGKNLCPMGLEKRRKLGTAQRASVVN